RGVTFGTAMSGHQFVNIAVKLKRTHTSNTSFKHYVYISPGNRHRYRYNKSNLSKTGYKILRGV
ncbi:MAG: hypothetical protein JW967_06195, partial [Dehalococcoidales bacterium]|nr:hypothetical protein [Dehalococcoidales bacterium]